LIDFKGSVVGSVWYIKVVDPKSPENIGYSTQKPMKLIERMVKSSCPEGGLVADFFCGSGTTLAVAEKLGRRWLGCDLGRFAIHTTRKRLLDIPDCKPFEILNLGKYERRYWQVNVINGRRFPKKDTQKAIFEYLAFIVELYHAQTVVGFSHLHGRKGGRMVHVGASDAPVTRSEIAEALKECSANRFNALDVLGWEWEMGLHDVYESDAKREGVDLRLLQIPREVMDRRAVQAGDVHFYELAHLETEVAIEGRTAQVKLRNFFIPNPELVPDDLRAQVKKWSDWIDYWAVDWDFASAGSAQAKEDTFHNQWQSYRTRRHPSLVTESDPYTYQNPGTYKVLVKVVDIFGNDTTKLIEVKV
jgi:SAM-dependent methyltransferase